MEPNIIFQDKNVLVIDKPAGFVVYSELSDNNQSLIDFFIIKYPELKECGKPPRYGIVHRLDKETSGIILIAKNEKTLFFLQKQFKTKNVEKKYIALVIGKTEQGGIIETLIGRSKKDGKKQKAYSLTESGDNKRIAITEYKAIENFDKYTLLEVFPKTGRKHQIRCHLSHINHPIAGDKVYGFKNQPCPEGLDRHFLHASYIKIALPDNEIKEFKSELPEQLKKIINNLKENYDN